MAVRWLKELDKECPTLAATARRLNAEDGFVMPEHRKKGKTPSGDDSRRERDADRKKRGDSKRSKRKGVESGNDHDEDGEESGSGKSGTSSSHKKRGRRDQSSDGSMHGNGLKDRGDERRPSASCSASTPPTCNGSPE